MKITQAQVRVIKSVIQTRAAEACTKAKEVWDANEKANNAAAYDAAVAVFRRHKAKLIASVQMSANTWGSPCPVFGDEAMLAFTNERDAAIKAIKTKGTDSRVSVEIPSLGMTECGSWRQREQNALYVPPNEVEQWRNLARKIDSAFMDGDAKRLLYIIEEYTAK